LQVLFLVEEAKSVAMEWHRMKRRYQSVSCRVAVELLKGWAKALITCRPGVVERCFL
jgi:hypothetical protein